MSKIEKVAGKFTATAWSGGWPISVDLKHIEPNGTEATLRLHGEEELHDLKHAVDRMIALVQADNPTRTT